MMSLQAKETFRPYIGAHHPLRAYPANSPRAKARLIALALLADGRLADSEIDALDHHGALFRLGIPRAVFYEVLVDFCADMMQLAENRDNALLTPAMLAGLLAEVDQGEERTKLLQIIFELAHSDGSISANEEILLQQAVEHWTRRYGSGLMAQQGASRPELYYG